MTSSVISFKRMASLVLAICFSASAFAQPDDAEQMMNLVLQVQALQDEVRQLRGQLEEQGYELENLKRRQRDQYLDLDQRIGELGGGARAANNGSAGAVAVLPQQTTPANAAQAGPAATPRAQPREDEPEVRAPMDAPSTTVALPEPETGSRAAQATPEMEQQAYDQAFQALKELRYADAAEAFRDFLADYPDSELADNAQYWLGESYYVTRNYDIALKAFEDLLRNYPDSAKTGDALLKVGFTHYELKHWDQSRAALEQVQQRFPGTTLARLAETRLRSMKLEGHM